MIAENGQSDGTLEYPFHYFEEFPTLREMASNRFCQVIWHANIISSMTNSTPLRNFFRVWDWKRLPRVDAVVEDLNLPKLIEEMLKQSAKKTYDELKGWTEYMKKISSSSNDQTFQVDIDWCVWSPNGEIDYRKSATKALNSGSLNEIQRFVVLSKFCMVDELKSTSSRTLLEAVEHRQFDVGSLEFYWVCYLKNKLERIPVNRGEALEKTMAYNCFSYSNRDMYGLEYFWHRLGNDDRISLAGRILCNNYWEGEWATLERLFRSICSSNPESLVVLSTLYLGRFMYLSSRSQHHLSIWHRFKSQIADEDYGCLIDTLFMKLVTSEDRMRMAIKIWDSAHDHHRQYVADRKVNSIITFFTRYNSGDLTRDPEKKKPLCSAAHDLLWRIILQVPEIERSRLIKQHVDALAATIESLDSLRKMLHLCLPSTEEQSQYKDTLSRSTKLQTTCVSLLEQSKLADLNANLEWVLSDRGPSALNDYKKLFLASMTSKYTSNIETFISSVAKWNELSQFVDETYAEDVQSAYEMKQMFVEKASSVVRYGRNFRQHFDIVRQIIEQVLPVQELAYFKRIRLHGLGDQLQSGVYWNDEQAGDEIFLQNFVEWCCDHDEESISKFKKSVPFCALLNRILFNVVHFHLQTELNVEALLRRFDWYLKWFVGSDEKVRECKLQAMEYCTVDTKLLRGERLSWEFPMPMQIPLHVQKIMLMRWHTNAPRPFNEAGREREMLLNWLCDNDPAAVQRFNQRFGNT